MRLPALSASGLVAQTLLSPLAAPMLASDAAEDDEVQHGEDEDIDYGATTGVHGPHVRD